MYCRNCEDKGWIIAWRKDSRDSGGFVFTCQCEPGSTEIKPWLKGRKFPNWSAALLKDFVPDYLDTPPTFMWLKHVDKKSEEFKKKIEIWGRDYFVTMWKRLEKDDSVLDETGGGEMPGMGGKTSEE